MKAILFFLSGCLYFTSYPQSAKIKIADQFNPPTTKIISVSDTYGIHDPRVIAWQPAKFASAVQHASTSGKPVFLDVN